MLQEVVTEDTTVGSNHFKATEDNPKVKVKSEKSGKEVSRCIPKMYSTCCAIRPTVGVWDVGCTLHASCFLAQLHAERQGVIALQFDHRRPAVAHCLCTLAKKSAMNSKHSLE